MNVACCLRSNAAYRQIEGPLQRHRLHPARFSDELPLLRALHGDDFGLVIVEMRASTAGDEGFFSWLRCRPAGAPPVLLVGSAIARERVARAFDSGIDEYCELPLDEIGFGARLRAVLRRCARPSAPRTVAFHGFLLDRELRTLHDRGLLVSLTPREFSMAWLFFSAPGVFVAHDAIGAALRPADAGIDERTIEQHVVKLRRKLGLGPARGVQLRAAPARGCRLEAVMVAPGGLTS